MVRVVVGVVVVDVDVVVGTYGHKGLQNEKKKHGFQHIL